MLRCRLRRARVVRRVLLAAAGLGLVGAMPSSAQPPTSAPAGVTAADRPRLAVLDFSVGEDIKPAHEQMLAAVVREEFQKADRFDLIDRDMMRQRMNEKDFAATTECNQVRCLVKYGRSLEVQKIVGGFTTSFGKT